MAKIILMINDNCIHKFNDLIVELKEIITIEKANAEIGVIVGTVSVEKLPLLKEFKEIKFAELPSSNGFK